MITYLDASAAVKLLVLEAETGALESRLDEIVGRGESVTSGWLLETELRRAAHRMGRTQVQASAVLDRIDLAEIDQSIYTQAALLPGPMLRTLDAIHVATAVRLGSDRMISYGARQLEAAIDVGLSVESPT